MLEDSTGNPRGKATVRPGDEPAANAHLSGAEAGQIGPYRLLQIIGEGGMGVVYQAEQREPVRRIVALKLIKPGMDTQQVIARFESERQALALLNHPNIARVYEAGATETGRPYFAMEYVPGEPITAYCDLHRLSTRQRIELFMQVCDAVQHAHRRGIIHRDIKPSNILVMLSDGKPLTKVIDFGVAKATDQRLTERTLFTEHGQLIGTPEYMSPEQATMSALDIDTRTDVYSLGVLLYELLSGTLPFDPKTFRGAMYAEIQRVIRDVDPPKPSTRLSSLGEESAKLAQLRSADSTVLLRQIRGDLDWIVMRAIEKDRSRRYGSASELADDIRRHLENRPVLAGPPGALYVAGKFIRRHRKAVLAGILLLLALLAGLAGTTWQAIRATRAEKLAKFEKDRAEARFAQVRELVSKFLFDFDKSIRDLPGATKPRQMLVATAQKYLDNLSSDPSADNQLLHELVIAYQKLGDVQGGTAGQSLGDTVGAMASFSKALAIAQQLAARTPDSPTAQRDIISTKFYIARVKQLRGQTGESLDDLRECSDATEKLLAKDSDNTAIQRDLALYLDDQADVYAQQAEFAKAIPLLQRVKEIRQKYADAHPDDDLGQRELAGVYLSFSDLYRAQGNVPKAIDSVERALEMHRKLLAGNPDSAQAMKEQALACEKYGDLLRASKNPDQAKKLYDESMQLRAKIAAADPNSAPSQRDLAIAHARIARANVDGGKYQDAMAEYQLALAILEKLAAKDPTSWTARRDVAAHHLYIADCYYGLKQFPEALAGYEKFLEFAEAMARRDPSKVATQMDVCKALQMVASTHLELSDASSDPAVKLQHERAAREKHVEGLAIVKKLAEEKKLPPGDERAVEEFAKAVAKSDEQIAKIMGSATTNPATAPAH